MAEDPLPVVAQLCLALPGTTQRLSHGSPTWFVRDKRWFVHYVDDHHANGILGIWCAAPPGVQEEMIAGEPERFFRPPYVGHRGWLGVRMNHGYDVEELREIVTDAYRTVAPRSLTLRLGDG